MSLEEKVAARLSAQLLINLTNPQNSGATTVDSGRLSAACRDVESDIRVYAGTAYDDTDGRHVATAVEGVLLKLRQYSGQVKMEDVQSAWVERLRALGRVTGRDRIVLQSTSQLKPTGDLPSGSLPPRPAFDERDWQHYVPDGPSSSPPYTSP